MLQFSCNTCGFKTESTMISENDEVVPYGWLTISGPKIQNELSNRALINADFSSSAMHFCSKRCFIDQFFKPEEKPTTLLTTADLKDCFEAGRLTHPMVGFKHQTFEDYILSLWPTHKTEEQIQFGKSF